MPSFKTDALNFAHLRLARRAHFRVLRKTTLSGDTLVHDVLDRLSPGLNIQQKRFGTSFAGFGWRTMEPEPVFLQGSAIREQRIALVVVVLHSGYIAISPYGAGRLALAHLDSLSDVLEAEELAHVLDNISSIQRLNIANMSFGASVRKRSFEGDNLEGAIPAAGMSRQILSGVRAQTATRYGISVHPGSSHASELGGALEIGEYVRWVRGCVRQFKKGPQSLAFLHRFAQPVRVKALPPGVTPSSAYVDLEWLRAERANGTYLYRVEHGVRQRLPAADEDLLIDQLSRPMPVTADAGPEKRYIVEAAATVKLRLMANKRSFSLHGGALSDLRIHHGEGDHDASLVEAIRTEGALCVAFSDASYAFLDGRLFKDIGIRSAVTRLTELIRVCDPLAKVSSEKGTVAGAKSGQKFETGSVFRVVEDEISKDETLLVCDDLGDEWADFIGLSPQPPRVVLYHGKHGDVTGSATAFHDVIGQALKNLGRITTAQAELQSKRQTWASRWSTALPRLRRGVSASDFADQYVAIASQATCQRVVRLVLSFVSATKFRRACDDIAAGNTVDGYTVQLVHILLGLMSACMQVGAIPELWVQP